MMAEWFYAYYYALEATGSTQARKALEEPTIGDES